MSRLSAAGLVAILLVVALCERVYADKHSNRPMERAQRALTYLLASANESIPAKSSCHGRFGVESQGKVRDLLAMELAALGRGRNVILGACEAGSPTQCSVKVSHAYGEDVSSADIRFRVKEDHVELESLDCVLSP